MIEIKNIDGVVLYTAETATDVRAALEEAVGAGTDLYRARLVGARLDGARLVGARLVGARLVGARLVGARLDGARLVGA
ncbi:MAG TPA: pentapeptide repeat-containing protein, partial [Baekduia sp.]